jgi:hypothetical protein
MDDALGFEMFKLSAAGYCCAQVMMKMVLAAEEKENQDLVRAVSGLCLGAGSCQKTCGVLTGGIAILALYAGKGNDREYPKQCFSKMVDDYTEWFIAEMGSTECKDIIGVCSVIDYQANESYQLKCGDIMMKGLRKVQEILQVNDFEFGSRDE